jgi:thioredoxin reductase/Pyruvate/2-oxoacid:ferredoxin oxidoreductase delta subunit
MDNNILEILVYAVAILFCLVVIAFYLWKQRKDSKKVEAKIAKAKLEGLYEPVSLHPVIDENSCIQTGACIAACPEKDIIGIVNGKAKTINASQCIGHGACFHSCPTQAITLCIGTETRGVELPHVNQLFESNISGIYIAGELGGMGLIKNAVTQGREAVENIAKYRKKAHDAAYDLIVVGAGPAGISASLAAKKLNMRCLTLEQDTLGGTVFTFPRKKIVMTSPMDLPLYGKVKLFETSKTELLDLWKDVITKHEIAIRENSKVEAIEQVNGIFKIKTQTGDEFTTKTILLAIGRRGTPRKLGIPGEDTEKVAYRLLEPEAIQGKNIVVVGGGDSAIESALQLCDNNKVLLSYRSDVFSRIKARNSKAISEAAASGRIDLQFNTNLVSIGKDAVTLEFSKTAEHRTVKNDQVYIFAGGELPTQFLTKIGIQITKKYGEAVLKH